MWPNKNPASKLSIYSYAYVYPYFHQSWNLFVPTPKQNFSILVKYKTGSKTQNWIDIFYQLNSKHQNNRLAGNESLMLAFSNALRYFSSSVEETNGIIENKNSNINFVVLEKIISKYLSLKEKTELQNLEIIINIKSVNSSINHSHYYCDKIN